MRLAPTLCALMIAAGPALAASKSRPKHGSAARARAAMLREEGLKAVAAGREDDALRAFGLAIEADPREEVSHHEIGKIFFRRGQTEEAIAHLRAAVRLQPKDTSAWYNLAFAERTAQKYPDAAEAYRHYAALSPDDPDAYYGLAESLRQSGRPGDAIEAYQQYLGKEKRDSEQKWMQRAKERIAELQPQADAEAQKKAEAEAQAQAEAEKKAEAAAQKKAEAQKKEEAAAAAFAPPGAAAPPPTAPPTAETKAKVAQVQSAVAPAAGASAGPTAPASADAVASAKIAEGDSALAAKDFRIALYAYQDAIMADPKNVTARVKAGHVYAKMGHDPEAIEQWNRALALDPANQEAQDGLSAAQARRAARMAPSSGTTIVTVTPPATAVAAATATRSGTATTPAAAAATAAPAVANPLTTLTAVPAASTTPPTFIPSPPVTASATGVDETAARQHYSSGVKLMRDRKYEAAVAELDQAIVLRPGYANALIARGSARISLGRFPDAAQDYAAARAADPTLAAPLFGLAEAYRQMGEPGKAIEMYRAFAESNAADAQPNLKAYARQTADSLSRK